MPVKDDSLVAQYIRNIENPDSIGFRDGMWFQSPRKVDDPNNRGFGVDIRFNEAKELVKGRPGKYLTEEEERTLRNNYISSMEGVLNKWTPKVLQEIPSEAKKAMATGMLYRGDGVKSIIKDPALRDAYYSGTNEQFQEAVSNYYNSKGTKHYQPERAKQHNKFIDSHTQEGFNWDNSFKPTSSLFEKGGLLEPKDEWDKLSMAAKAEMMRVAVNHGIYDLQTIRQKYNEFAEGGSTDWSYDSWKSQIGKYLGINIDEDNGYDYEGYFRKYPEEAWKMLKGDPDAHFTDEFKTVYHPTFSSASLNNDGSIYSGVKHPIYNPQGLKGGTWSPDYKEFTMSSDGYKGPVDMEDRAWYLMNNENNGVVLRESDGTLPLFDGIPWAGVLPNVTVQGHKHSIGGPIVDAAMNEYRNGGGIHIKHPGRLTELKKRTGKTEAELYNDGNPAHKKMVVFARNARRWKHRLGGNLFYPGGDTKASDYRYVLDDDGEWHRVANNEMGRVFQGLTVTPTGGSGQPAPARYRISYDAGVTKDDAAPIRNLFSKIQEVADTPIMVQANPGTATGYNSFGQYMPKSQSTYGDQTNLLLTELTAPTVLSDAKGIYQVLRHPAQTFKAVRSIFSEGTPAAEWAMGYKTAPQITAENAASMTPKQWDNAYLKALDTGDKTEAQRLRDLHFLNNAPNTKIVTQDNKPAHIYHGTDEDWVQYDANKFGSATDEGYYGVGLYGTEYRPLAKGYGDNVLDLYVNSKHPFTAGTQNIEGKPYGIDEAIDRTSAIYYFNRSNKPTNFHKVDPKTDVTKLFKELDASDAAVYGTPTQRFNEVIIPRGEQIKLADVVTYDDAGNVIPLSKRDNFNINDIRYGIIPIGISTMGLSSYLKTEKDK